MGLWFQVLFHRTQVVEAEERLHLGVVVARKTLAEVEERTSLMEVVVVEVSLLSLSTIYVEGHEDLCIHWP
jgi:hypothetical protein